METFEEAARRIVGEQLADNIPSAPARLSRLERWAFPVIGALPVTEVKPGHISGLLADAAALGRGSTTIVHFRGDLSTTFAELLREEAVTRNPAKAELIRTPVGEDDDRKRTILRDEEFAALVQAPTTPAQLRIMAICSRAFGGMRTSDLQAWQWDHVDLVEWAWAEVPRPKTTKRRKPGAPALPALERIDLPETVAADLHAWWQERGGPTSGPVFIFPAAKYSFARDLRQALLDAGVDRHELHHDTERSRRVDFHSFRRAYSTAIANSGLNAQSAMQLTGHKNLKTHMLYVVPESLQIPAGAVPNWEKPIPLSFRPGPADPEDLLSAGNHSCAKERTRTSTGVTPLAPQASDVCLVSSRDPNLSGIIDLNARLESRLKVAGASKFGVVDSKLVFRRASDAAIQAYLRVLADDLAERVRVDDVRVARSDAS